MTDDRPGSKWDDEDDRWPHEGEGSWKQRYEQGKGKARRSGNVQLYSQGVNVAYQALGYLLGGMLVWGGIGFLIDWLAGFHYLFLPIGLAVGLAGGIFLTVRQAGASDTRRSTDDGGSGGR
jgi:F0F1-type ATP synthase assembly protein I